MGERLFRPLDRLSCAITERRPDCRVSISPSAASLMLEMRRTSSSRTFPAAPRRPAACSAGCVGGTSAA
jgi:hypothetical protein